MNPKERSTNLSEGSSHKVANSANSDFSGRAVSSSEAASAHSTEWSTLAKGMGAVWGFVEL